LLSHWKSLFWFCFLPKRKCCVERSDDIVTHPVKCLVFLDEWGTARFPKNWKFDLLLWRNKLKKKLIGYQQAH
jgi:hypothetical protein